MMTLDQLKSAILKNGLEEMKILSHAWHNMDPRHETPQRNRHNVNVAEYGGYASAFFSAFFAVDVVTLYELDKLIADLEEDMAQAQKSDECTLITGEKAQ